MARKKMPAPIIAFPTGRQSATGGFRDQPTSEQAPLCLPSETEALSKRLQGVLNGKESLLIIEFENFFSSGLELEYVISFMLCVNALTMWKTGGPVTRLLVLSGDVSMQGTAEVYGFANQFRAFMQGGFARIDNAGFWIRRLGIELDLEPLDFRDFRRAVRVFSAARVSPDAVPALAYAEWYFDFRTTGPRKSGRGHFNYDVVGSHSVKISAGETSLNLEFVDRFTSGPCEILAAPSRSIYRISIDLTGVKTPFPGSSTARYLDVFSSLIGASNGTRPAFDNPSPEV